MEEVRIDYLYDHRDFVPTVARWIYGEWSDIIDSPSEADFVEHVDRRMRRREIPTTFVAFCEDRPVGSCSLLETDLKTRMDLSPWLAEVFVLPAYRRRGIGRALVERAVEEATALGLEALYLFTPDREGFYARLGWSVVGPAELCGQDIVIMSRRLSR
jgi:GNAT superfamily N-acetyltransferase